MLLTLGEAKHELRADLRYQTSSVIPAHRKARAVCRTIQSERREDHAPARYDRMLHQLRVSRPPFWDGEEMEDRPVMEAGLKTALWDGLRVE